MKINSYVLLRLLQRKSKTRSLVVGAVNVDGLFMRFDDVLNDGKAQACTACFARTAFVNAKETLKYSGKIFRLDADAVVRYFYRYSFRAVMKSCHGSAAGFSVFNRVGY